MASPLLLKHTLHFYYNDARVAPLTSEGVPGFSIVSRSSNLLVGLTLHASRDEPSLEFSVDLSASKIRVELISTFVAEVHNPGGQRLSSPVAPAKLCSARVTTNPGSPNRSWELAISPRHLLQPCRLTVTLAVRRGPDIEQASTEAICLIPLRQELFTTLWKTRMDVRVMRYCVRAVCNMRSVSRTTMTPEERTRMQQAVCIPWYQVPIAERETEGESERGTTTVSWSMAPDIEVLNPDRLSKETGGAWSVNIGSEGTYRAVPMIASDSVMVEAVELAWHQLRPPPQAAGDAAFHAVLSRERPTTPPAGVSSRPGPPSIAPRLPSWADMLVQPETLHSEWPGVEQLVAAVPSSGRAPPVACPATVPAPLATMPAPPGLPTVPAPLASMPTPLAPVPTPFASMATPFAPMLPPCAPVFLPLESAPTPFVTVPAPFATVPAPFATVPAPFATVPAPFATVPAPDPANSRTLLPLVAGHEARGEGAVEAALRHALLLRHPPQRSTASAASADQLAAIICALCLGSEDGDTKAVFGDMEGTGWGASREERFQRAVVFVNMHRKRTSESVWCPPALRLAPVRWSGEELAQSKFQAIIEGAKGFTGFSHLLVDKGRAFGLVGFYVQEASGPLDREHPMLGREVAVVPVLYVDAPYRARRLGTTLALGIFFRFLQLGVLPVSLASSRIRLHIPYKERNAPVRRLLQRAICGLGAAGTDAAEPAVLFALDLANGGLPDKQKLLTWVEAPAWQRMLPRHAERWLKSLWTTMTGSSRTILFRSVKRSREEQALLAAAAAAEAIMRAPRPVTGTHADRNQRARAGKRRQLISRTPASQHGPWALTQSQVSGAAFTAPATAIDPATLSLQAGSESALTLALQAPIDHAEATDAFVCSLLDM